MSRINRFAYAITSGILLSLAWTDWMNGLILIIAFVPLLVIENYFFRNQDRFKSVQVFLYSILTFAIWNTIATWWLWKASPASAISAIGLNTIWMSSVIWLFHFAKRKIGERAGYFALVFFWIAFEYFHTNWEMNWSLLNLGNGFGKNIRLIQWYEFTGILGGSLWVILSNVLIMIMIKKQLKFRTFHAYLGELIFLVIWIATPIIISINMYHHYEEKDDAYDIVVLQPNVNPYSQKYDASLTHQQLDDLLQLADSLGDNNVDFFIGPETFLTEPIWEHELSDNVQIKELNTFLDKYPSAYFVLGLSTKGKFELDEELSHTARYDSSTQTHFDMYNTAMILDSDGNHGLYHKSKLVIGVERMPFSKTLGFLENWIVDAGGVTGSLGTQQDRAIFKAYEGKLRIAPVICYESVYGEFVSEYVKNGANIIFVITNDGWWGKTSGHKQHLRFSQLRAIETRRSIARSANTGITCFINQRGDLIQPTEYWTEDVIRASLNTNDKLTWYVQNGDYLGRIFSFFSILILLFTLTNSVVRKDA